MVQLEEVEAPLRFYEENMYEVVSYKISIGDKGHLTRGLAFSFCDDEGQL